MRWGIKAVIAESFAEIFFGNCTSLGIPVVRASRSDLEALDAAIKSDPTLDVTVDLAGLKVTFGGKSIDVETLESARDSLTTGQWDFLGQLLDAKDAVAEQSKKIPYLNGFASA